MDGGGGQREQDYAEIRIVASTAGCRAAGEVEGILVLLRVVSGVTSI